MTTRAHDLWATADRQIAELTGLLSSLDEAALGRRCPGREKLGDGTIGASARHTIDNYQRIGAFVQTGDDMRAPNALVAELSASRNALGRIASLTDSQLDQVPPKDSFRFCDGRRTLEQVLAGLLKHQAHQVDALSGALA